MKVVVRTDASVQIGSGHVMRCLTLAEGLRDKGAEVRFACRELPGSLNAMIAAKGFALWRLPAPGEPAAGLDWNRHANWLGVDWRQDADETLACLHTLEEPVDWLVVDHYALDRRWEVRVAKAVGRIMVIDDLADRAHEANFLLDQNVMSSAIKERYKKQVNLDCKLLLGPRYALLGQEYRILADALPERDGQVFRVLVFVGGSDPHHLTERYLKALNADDLQHLQVDVVIGKNHPEPSAVFDLVSSRKNTRLYSGLPSLAALMIRADLMLGAGGATNWERICLGLNSIVISAALNQDIINKVLRDNMLINFMGKAKDVSIDSIRTTIRFVLEHTQRNFEQSQDMRKVVDGRGCGRVIDKLLLTR